MPRLFVYHSTATKNSEADTMLQMMERRLMRFIMNPAMIATFALGIWLMVMTGAGGPGSGGWMHMKLALILALTVSHMMMAKYRKAFARGERPKSSKYFRMFNEVPTLIMIVIVLLVVLKPF